MTARDQVLVAILNDRLDFVVARDQHWYRIPQSSVFKWVQNRWPPCWLAFYQTKVFGAEAFAINYYAKVQNINLVPRWHLFPDGPRDARSQRLYYQLQIGPLHRLRQPLLSHRRRRIIFIPTTWQKFQNAKELNDLYDDSPLEDRLWAELRRCGIRAERQEYVKANGHDYALDFAVYCVAGKLDIETDGDTWHADPQRIPEDNLRDNDMETEGWKLLRFNTHHIHEQLEEYCLKMIVDNINRLGGLDEGGLIGQRVSTNPEAPRQLSLFEDQPE
jgi:very-short-patch-repair endonuclease